MEFSVTPGEQDPGRWLSTARGGEGAKVGPGEPSPLRRQPPPVPRCGPPRPGTAGAGEEGTGPVPPLPAGGRGGPGAHWRRRGRCRCVTGRPGRCCPPARPPTPPRSRAAPGDGGGGGRSSGSRCGAGGRACPRGGESAGARGRRRSPLGDTTRGPGGDGGGAACPRPARPLSAMERRGCRAGAGLPLWSAGLGLGPGLRLEWGRPRPTRGRAVVRACQRPAGSGQSRPRQSQAHVPSLSPGPGPAGEGAVMVPHLGQEPARG